MRRSLGLVLGPAGFALLLLLPLPGLAPDARKAAAVALLMGVFWISEALPIAATSLLPLALFPLLGVRTIAETASPYANPVIFLFLGGFVLAAGLERSGLHRRLAFRIIALAGARRRNLLLGFMVATALLSAGVSNTATVALMLPMAISVLDLVDPKREEGAGAFGTALMLGLAYAATIGGLMTLIGTPPNALLAGYLAQTHGITIGFAQWMLVGVPLAAVALPLCWVVLVRLHPFSAGEVEGGRELIRRELASMGATDRRERLVAAIALLVAAAWILRPFLERAIPSISDPGIAVIGALLLFAIPFRLRPLEFVIGAGELEAIPWSVLLLFGGGLSLAGAIESSGLARAMGEGMESFRSLPPWLVMLLIATIVIFLTEMTSNTATAATFLPIVGSAAIGMGKEAAFLAIPAALAASCAFMLPVATPPNAIVFGSGRLTVPEMARAGIWMNLLMVALIGAVVTWVVPVVMR
jgi:sodium-dependent dicarboxylate transporter 2/3/5